MHAKRLIMIGSSGHAKVAVDLAKRAGWHLAGLLDDTRPVGPAIGEVAITGPVSSLLDHFNRVDAVFIAIGENVARRRIAEQVRALAPGLPVATLIHPSAVVAQTATVEQGALVAAGAVVGPDARVAEFAIVNTLAGLDHDSILERYASLGPRAVAAGRVRIGEETLIGIGALISHSVSIGARSVLGAGAVALHDLPDLVVAFGVPATIRRSRRADESHF